MAYDQNLADAERERDEAVDYVNQRDAKLRELADLIVDKIEYDTGKARGAGFPPSFTVAVYWPAAEWSRIVRLLTPHQTDRARALPSSGLPKETT